MAKPAMLAIINSAPRRLAERSLRGLSLNNQERKANSNLMAFEMNAGGHADLLGLLIIPAGYIEGRSKHA